MSSTEVGADYPTPHEYQIDSYFTQENKQEKPGLTNGLPHIVQQIFCTFYVQISEYSITIEAAIITSLILFQSFADLLFYELTLTQPSI